MKFCPNCGAPLSPGMKFCTECGTKLAMPTPAPVYEAPAAEPVYEAPAPADTWDEPVSEPAPADAWDEPAPEPAPADAWDEPVSEPAPADAWDEPAPEPAPADAWDEPAPEPAPADAWDEPAPEPIPEPAPEPPVAAPKAAPQKIPAEKKSAGKLPLPLIAGAAALVVLAVVLLLIFGGGKNQGTEADWGVYEGVSCTVSGMDLGADGEWIELQKKGKAVLFIMDEEYKAKWTLDGSNIVIKQGGDTFPGTLKNGTLEVNIVGMTYTFSKPNAAKPNASLPGKNDKNDKNDKQEGPVTYKLISFISDGVELEADVVEMMGGGYIVFNGDGTGTFTLFGDSCSITYDGKEMDVGGEKMPYRLTDNGMEFDMGSDTFTLEVTDETPALPEPGEDPEAADPGVPVHDVQDWAGDYYGYWVVTAVQQGEWMDEGSWWDCCAALELDEMGSGKLIIWDEDFEKAAPMADVTVTALDTEGVARINSENGYFIGMALDYNDWLWYTDDTEYGDLFVINGKYDDGEDAFSYTIYLRPWGTDWSDMEAKEETLPYYYYDWYLPMVESGVTEAPAGPVAE